ncbi:MAG: SUF system NifU family Fe-S cluster assembly protein [Candidatus Marinimicrobia bacterium]|nr:SUF system NifU family Fe-S cluster assembly protein [Candidatus Neomarinimicrobiota bacterium]
MNDLRDLYQQLILDHNKSPRNFGVLEGANRSAQGYNPLCGDEINVSALLGSDIIEAIKFEGAGCAISKASASIMTTVVKGKTVQEARVIIERFHRMATTGEMNGQDMGKLAALADIHKYPARVKCAMLAWRTLSASLEQQPTLVSTE